VKTLGILAQNQKMDVLMKTRAMNAIVVQAGRMQFWIAL